MIRKIAQFFKEIEEEQKANKKYDEEYFLKVEQLIEKIKNKKFYVSLSKFISDDKWFLVMGREIEIKRDFNNLKEVYNFLIEFLEKIEEFEK